ncbi:CcdB family protein [Sulfitobacter sp. HNIBRBA3233]|uniref:CcdB family protein n=1 Tax=Sulfitobacter marinivivus TaxID=3158558 RepID=UPI0032DF7A7B
MAQYDVFRVGSGLVVDVQTDLVTVPMRRVVVPLVLAEGAPPPTDRLHPGVVILGERYLMLTHLLGAVPDLHLRDPVANLASQTDEITRALDMLFHGF